VNSLPDSLLDHQSIRSLDQFSRSNVISDLDFERDVIMNLAVLESTANLKHSWPTNRLSIEPFTRSDFHLDRFANRFRLMVQVELFNTAKLFLTTVEFPYQVQGIDANNVFLRTS